MMVGPKVAVGCDIVDILLLNNPWYTEKGLSAAHQPASAAARATRASGFDHRT